MKAQPITAALYQQYGDLIMAARPGVTAKSANLGYAERFDFLASLQNFRAADPGTRANLSVFRCKPMIPAGTSHFDVNLLERHPQSTQVFLPMHDSGRFLAVVARGGASPDLATLQAFMVEGGRTGITYHPGIWHHPLIVLDRLSDFACLVWENGKMPDDCDVHQLAAPVRVNLSNWSP